jgi:hypothetical protein
MDFGYLIFVSTTKEYDYLKMAYASALSIKNTQKEGFDKVALVIDDKRELKKIKSPWVFDKIIEWDLKKHWDGRSWMDQLTPWDSTVCIDADMLFLRDNSHWIEYFIENCDLYIPSKAYTVNDEIITDDFYRKTFTYNKLPNLYSFFTFFKKNKNTEFFELQRTIVENPVEFSNLFLSEYKPKVVGTDEAFSLAAKILDIADEVSYTLDFPKILHMKPMVQNWPWAADKVTDHRGFYLNDRGQLKLGNYFQTNIIHYVEKDLMTDELISLLEEIAWTNK